MNSKANARVTSTGIVVFVDVGFPRTSERGYNNVRALFVYLKVCRNCARNTKRTKKDFAEMEEKQ